MFKRISKSIKEFFFGKPKPKKKRARRTYTIPMPRYIVEEEDKEISICEAKKCNNPLNYLASQCPYCRKWHCSDHILPENHGCPNPQLPNYMRNHGASVRYGR